MWRHPFHEVVEASNGLDAAADNRPHDKLSADRSTAPTKFMARRGFVAATVAGTAAIGALLIGQQAEARQRRGRPSRGVTTSEIRRRPQASGSSSPSLVFKEPDPIPPPGVYTTFALGEEG